MTATDLTLIILAGGANSRFWPLREKSLIRFNDKPLLEHQVENYIALGIKHIAVVCNPDNHDVIRAALARFEGKIKISTSIQKEARGMGDALLSMEPLLEKASGPMPVYICQVHDIFDPSFHKNMLAAYTSEPNTAWLASFRVKEYFPGGYLIVDSDLKVSGIIEKPAPDKAPSDLVSIVAHIHPDFRRLLENIKAEYASPLQSDDHYERAMGKLMTQMTFKTTPYNGLWCPIKYPWHVIDAMNYFLDNLKEYRAEDVHIEPGVVIKGVVHIEKGVHIFTGADIRGPAFIGANTIVGQFASIRQSMVSENCIVGLASEVNRSYLGRGSWMHGSKALDSILGENMGPDQHINLSSGVITANFRQDGGVVKSVVKGQRLETGRTKLGSIIGAGAFIGINCCLAPGIKLGENSQIGMGTNVSKDISDHTRYYFDQELGKKVEKKY